MLFRSLDPLDPAGVFLTGGALNPENAKKGMAAMVEEITKLATTGISADELKIAKQGLLEAFQRDLSNDGTVLRMLHDGLYLGRKTDFWVKRNAALGALTVEQVNSAAQRHLRPGSLVKIIAGDKKKM